MVTIRVQHGAMVHNDQVRRRHIIMATQLLSGVRPGKTFRRPWRRHSVLATSCAVVAGTGWSVLSVSWPGPVCASMLCLYSQYRVCEQCAGETVSTNLPRPSA